jgi:oxygen-dependent protoporphyrinogen oxidase
VDPVAQSGRSSEVSAHVVVVGGGISGLAAAHRLVEAGGGVAVTVLESGARLGGQVWTDRQGEFLLEGGADALLAQKPAGIALCKRLGLEGELEDVSARGGGTEVLRRRRLVRVPDGFLLMAPTRTGPMLRSSLFSVRGKLRMLAEPWVSQRSAGTDDESLASFVRRRFGREVLERVAEPVIASLYTADAERLSLRMTMPRFLDLEAKEGSVTRGLQRAMSPRGPRPFGHGTGGGGFVAIRGGLGRIVEALAARLPAGSIRTGARAASLRSESALLKVVLEGGESLAADAVVLACPAYEIARLLPSPPPGLEGLSYASCATVHLAYRRQDVQARLASFGFFVPRAERLPILACSYVSEKFQGRAPADTVVVRAFLGGALHPAALREDDAALGLQAHEALRRILRISGAPLFAKVHRHERAMPQYDVGTGPSLASLVREVEAQAGIFVTGSAAGAVGIPDCVRVAEDAAARAAAYVGGRVAYQANQNA